MKTKGDTKNISMKTRQRWRAMAAAGTFVFLAAILTGCSSDSRQLGRQVVAIHTPGVAVPDEDRDEDCPLELESSYCELIDNAAEDGAQLAIWLVLPGSTARLREVDVWDFKTDGNNSSQIEQRSARLAEEAKRRLASEIGGIRQAAVDDEFGIDLVGALDQLMDELPQVEGEGPAQIRLLTAGGVHRSGQLDLAQLEEASAWEPEVARLSAAASDLSEAMNGETVSVHIAGVGNFSHRATQPAAEVKRVAEDFWDSACESIANDKEGRTCSPTQSTR